MRNKWVLIPLILIALSLIFPAVIAQVHEEEISGVSNTIEIILDGLVLIAIATTIFLGMGTFGGVIGAGLKFVFIGLLLFGIDYILQALHHFGVDLIGPLVGEVGHVITHHLLILIAFILIAYGFYKIRQVTKA